jgi:lactate dehydrogenase-like 2-hydroxyacid dehydrogenase
MADCRDDCAFQVENIFLNNDIRRSQRESFRGVDPPIQVRNVEDIYWNKRWSRQDDTVRLPLNELLRTCDVASLLLRLSKASTRLLHQERLDSMKQGAVLITSSRGAIVDEEALI